MFFSNIYEPSTELDYHFILKISINPTPYHFFPSHPPQLPINANIIFFIHTSFVNHFSHIYFSPFPFPTKHNNHYTIVQSLQ